MKKLLKIITSILKKNRKMSLEEAVKYSVEKYFKTYKLLEKYDSSSEKETPRVAEPEEIKNYIQNA